MCPCCCNNLKFKIAGSPSIWIAVAGHSDTVELGYNVTSGAEHIVLLYKSAGLTERRVLWLAVRN